jgi:hypothetical protein
MRKASYRLLSSGHSLCKEFISEMQKVKIPAETTQHKVKT